MGSICHSAVVFCQGQIMMMANIDFSRYLFSREHDVIRKWRKFLEQTGCVSSIVQPTTRSTLGVYDSRSPLARYVR